MLIPVPLSYSTVYLTIPGLTFDFTFAPETLTACSCSGGLGSHWAQGKDRWWKTISFPVQRGRVGSASLRGSTGAWEMAHILGCVIFFLCPRTCISPWQPVVIQDLTP